MFGSGNTTLIISNEEMNDIMKIVESVEVSGFFIKGITGTFKNKAKEQKEGFLSMLLGTLGASLLGNLLAGKRTIKAGDEEHLELMKALLDQVRIFNVASSFNKFWNTNVLSTNLNLMVFIQEITYLK